jgi:hypothetical protein
MIILNRYALKKEYYILKLVGLVLALNVVLILDWSREHLAQAEEVNNVTIYNSEFPSGQHPSTDDVIMDYNLNYFDDDLQFRTLTPKNFNGDTLLPSDNIVVVNGSVDYLDEIFIAGGLGYSANSDNNTVILNNSANINGSVYGGYGNGTLFNATNNKVVINTTGGVIGRGQVVGGFSSGGTVENNVVNFTSGTVRDLFGGYTGNGTAKKSIRQIKTVENSCKSHSGEHEYPIKVALNFIYTTIVEKMEERSKMFSIAV